MTFLGSDGSGGINNSVSTITESIGISAAGLTSSRPVNGISKFTLEYYGHAIATYPNLLILNVTFTRVGV